MGVPMCPGCRAILDGGVAVCPYCGWEIVRTVVRREGGPLERLLRPLGGGTTLLVVVNVALALVAAGLSAEAIVDHSGGRRSAPDALVDGILSPLGGVLHALGAVTPEDVLAGGQAWRLAASCFLHFGLLHLAVNMMSLWHLGRDAEVLFGTGKAVALYVLSGLSGAAASVGWVWLRLRTGGDPDLFLMAGASGAIFGLAGLLASVAWRIGGPAGRQVAFGILRNVGFMFALGLILEFVPSSFRLANAAHAGGFLFGAAAGAICTFGVRARGNPAVVRAWDVAGGLLLLAALASLVPGVLDVIEFRRG